MKRIVLCADDYGQAPNISHAIIELIEKRRISATSCLVTSPHWSEHSSWLKPYENQIDLGLHLNLTEGQPLSSVYKDAYGPRFKPLRNLLRSAFFRGLNVEIIAAEFDAQCNQFCELMGRPPTFIDGHQHVHQFPVVRQALLKVYGRYQPQVTYIRLPKVVGPQRTFNDSLKVKIIQMTGTTALERLLTANRIPHNRSFAGIYAFSTVIPYGKLFPSFLKCLGEGGLLMCHPGHAAKSVLDPIASARFQEYTYLASLQFETDCSQNQVIMGRFGQSTEFESK